MPASLMAIDPFSPAQLLGYAALCFGVTAFLQKNDKRLKALLACESLAYIAHFALLGNLPAGGSSVISFLRNAVSIGSRSPWWVVVFLTANIGVGVVFCDGLISWLPVVGSCFATVAVFLFRGVPMRLLFLVTTLLWLANNILSGSIGGTLLEGLIALVNLSTMARVFIDRQLRRCHKWIMR